jgi:hypothetical protein
MVEPSIFLENKLHFLIWKPMGHARTNLVRTFMPRLWCTEFLSCPSKTYQTLVMARKLVTKWITANVCHLRAKFGQEKLSQICGWETLARQLRQVLAENRFTTKKSTRIRIVHQYEFLESGLRNIIMSQGSPPPYHESQLPTEFKHGHWWGTTLRWRKILLSPQVSLFGPKLNTT